MVIRKRARRERPEAAKRPKRESVWTYGRRSFLSVCAGGGVAAAAGTALATARGRDEEEQPERNWSMGIDISKCIGCGRCAAACRQENDVPEGNYRTWIERYVVHHDGTVHVDSPSGGEFGFPDNIDPADVRRSFHVPKLCNQRVASASPQVCPGGPRFEAPDGVALVDPSYCVGCSYCVQACPYGCRFINPETQVADKCTFCYHRVSNGEVNACVLACPTGARILGDLNELDKPIEEADFPDFVRFMRENAVQVLKPHLGTRPKVFYAHLDHVVT